MSAEPASVTPTPYSGPIPVTAWDLAERFTGIGELRGADDNPLIQWFLSLVGFGPKAHDEVPWCSAFVNAVAWLLFLPRSSSAAARSWLTVGQPVPLAEAVPGFDVVVLSRGPLPQPGPEVVSGASGHVGFFGGLVDGAVLVLGGNQADQVSIARFPAGRVLGVRRLRAPGTAPSPADVRRSLGAA